MKKPLKFLIGLIIIGFAILTPFYFDEILFFTVGNIGIGWVWTTIFIRLLVMFLLIYGLNICLTSFNKKILKTWLIIIIGSVLGFGCSFVISPIYDVDYFMQNDSLKLDHLSELNEATGKTYERKNQYEVFAFLDVGCSHCKVAGQRLGINYKAGQQIPIHLFFNGDDADINHFREQNGVLELTYHKLPSQAIFAYFAGFEFPSIFLINPDGQVEYHWVAQELNYSALDYLLSLEQ